MSKESEHKERQDEEVTHDLLALLYSEDGAMKGEELDDELAEELEGFKSVRSLFAQMEEEEPSHAGMQQLLAAAAKEAPKPAEEKRGFFGWLSDLMMPIAHHPGLAAAASLMVVAGVAGTLYVTGGDKIAQPEVSSRHEAPAETTSDEPAAPAVVPTTTAAGGELELAEEEIASEADDAPAEDPASAANESDGFNSRAKAEKKKLKLDAPAERQSKELKDLEGSIGGAKGGGGAPGGVIGGSLDDGVSTDSSSGRRDRKSRSSSSTGSSSGAGDLNRGVGKKSASGPVAEPPPPPKPKPEAKPEPEPEPEPTPQQQAPAPKKPASPPADLGESVDEDEGGAADKKQDSGPTVQELHNQAVTAVKKGNCSRYREIAAQIRQMNSAYYDRSFLSDKRLAPCRTAKGF